MSSLKNNFMYKNAKLSNLIIQKDYLNKLLNNTLTKLMYQIGKYYKIKQQPFLFFLKPT